MDNLFYPCLVRYYVTGRDNYLIYNLNKKELSFITKEEAKKISAFSCCQTPDEIDNSFIKNLESVLKTEPKSSAIKENKKDFSVSVITNDRPQFLKAAIETIVNALAKHNVKIPITVFDDSVETTIADQNSETVKQTSENLYPNISYFGKKEKDSFLDALFKKTEAHGIEKKLLDFALYGRDEFKICKGPGGNRNISILKSAGKKIISFDDDIEIISNAEKRDASFSNKDISFDKNPEAELFDDMKKAEKILSNFDKDPLASFFETTGAYTKELLEDAINSGAKIDTEEFRADTGYSIEKTGGKIIATMAGLYGGRWFSRIGKIYTNNGANRTRFYKKKSVYQNIKKNPLVSLFSSSIRISNAPLLITSAYSIDLSGITAPPFPPSGRNEDSIWALLALYVNKNSFIAHIPAAVYHSEKNKKDLTEKNYSDASADLGLINFLIIDYIKTRESFFMLDPSLAYIGKHLRELSQYSVSDWLDMCNMVWMKYTGKFIEELENNLDIYKKKPKFWAADVIGYIELLKKQALSPHNSLPSEFRAGNSIEDACKLHKLFLGEYGKLLEAWPSIMEAAYAVSGEKKA